MRFLGGRCRAFAECVGALLGFEEKGAMLVEVDVTDGFLAVFVRDADVLFEDVEVLLDVACRWLRTIDVQHVAELSQEDVFVFSFVGR